MSETPRADVRLIHVAAGEGRNAPPPGSLALSAPRRAARGRSHDFLFINLTILNSNADGRASRLTHLAAQAFFGTPGSVTSALRQAAMAVNQSLVDDGVEGRMITGALRNNNLYLAQTGSGQAILVRSGAVSRMNAPGRPLGSSLAPMIQFHHVEIRHGDLIVLGSADESAWSDAGLAGLTEFDLNRASEQLVSTANTDLTGIVIRIPGSGGTVSKAVGPSPAAVPPQDSSLPRPGPQTEGVPAKIPSYRSRRLLYGVRKITGRISQLIVTLMVRLAPGTMDAQQFGEFSPNLLAFTAAAVPILVVGISSVVYFKHGRAEQLESYLAQAEAAVILAQLQDPGESSRPDWEMASQWLDLAESYQVTEESSFLRTQVGRALDDLNLLVRLDFVPAISGGFGPRAEITEVAATATDLYAYDAGTETIWHAWATGRGYEIDSQFDCLANSRTIPDFGGPVSMVVQPEPGALGTEGVVAVDGDGTLLYCAPGAEPHTGQLADPDVGWGKIQAIEVFGDDLYVLDPVKNVVWIYDAADGLFSGSPALYFVEDVRELGTAVDLALAQDELIILYADGGIDRCRRVVENTIEGNLRIRVECEIEPQFQDERAGFKPLPSIPGADPATLVYSPPPEPSLFFLDSSEGTVFHFSMRLVYQAQYPTSFDQAVTAITSAPPNDLFVAAGDQIYYAQLGR